MTLEPIRPAQIPETPHPEAQTPTPAAPSPAPGAELSADEQSELDLGVISTGAPDIDRALAPLEGLGERPVSDHPAVYEQVLGELSATMADNTVADTAVESGEPGEPGDPAVAGPADAQALGGG